MAKVVFETATFADAIKNVGKVAPRKGQAFDKAAGIVIEFDPSISPPIVVRATNLDVFYREWVDAVETEGGPSIWRLPADLLVSMMASLPIGSGRTVTLQEVTKGASTYLQISSGKTKARFNLMLTDYYPEWDIFDPDELTVINDLGGRISMVEWAADKGPNPPINGLFFSGDEIITTDRYRLARTPLKVPNIPGDKDVIVPAGILGSVLKQTGEVRIGFTEHQMLLMPNDTTQLRVVRYDAIYPPKISNIMVTDRPAFVELNKDQVLEVMRRATAFSGADRMPTIRVFLGAEEFAVMMDNTDVGVIADTIDVPGQCVHKRIEIRFTPKYVMEAIEKSPNERVKIGYDPEKPSSIIYIDGDSGYEAWVVTRAEGD